MTFDPDKVDQFLKDFDQVKEHIRNFEGVQHLELLRDKNNTNVLFTYSIWESEAHLEQYRTSDLFKSVWANTKPYFIENAAAWSVDSMVKLD